MGPAEQSTPRPASTPARSARPSPPGAHHPARWPARPAAPPTATPPSARTTTGTPPGRRHPAPAPNAAMRYPGRSRSRRRATPGPSAPAAKQEAASSRAAAPGRKSPATAQACDAPEADGPREDAAQQPIVLVDNGGNDWTFPLFSPPTSEAGGPTPNPRLSRAGEELATTRQTLPRGRADGAIGSIFSRHGANTQSQNSKRSMRPRTNRGRLMPSRRRSTTPARNTPSPIREQFSQRGSGHSGPSWSGSLSPSSQKHYRLGLRMTRRHGNMAPRQVAEKSSSFTGRAVAYSA